MAPSTRKHSMNVSFNKRVQARIQTFVSGQPRVSRGGKGVLAGMPLGTGNSVVRGTHAPTLLYKEVPYLSGAELPTMMVYALRGLKVSVWRWEVISQGDPEVL